RGRLAVFPRETRGPRRGGLERARPSPWRAPLRAPELPRRQVGALGHRLELGPGDGRVTDTRAEPTVGPGDDVLAADKPRVRHQALGDELRMLDEVAVVSDRAGQEEL